LAVARCLSLVESVPFSVFLGALTLLLGNRGHPAYRKFAAIILQKVLLLGDPTKPVEKLEKRPVKQKPREQKITEFEIKCEQTNRGSFNV